MLAPTRKGVRLIALAVALSSYSEGVGVEDVLSTLGWHEPHVEEGQEVFGPKGVADLPTCTNLRISVLDLGSFAYKQGLEPCSTLHMGDQQNLMQSAYSGPLHLAEAIRTSQYFVSDIESADIVFVDDYCYYITGKYLKEGVLARGEGLNESVRGADMLAVYEKLAQSTRWWKRLGADFVFYDAYLGFDKDGSGIPLDRYLCSTFRNSTLLTVDQEWRRQTCVSQNLEPLPRSRVMIVPPVPHRIDPSRGDMHLKRKLVPAHRRAIRVNKRALCPDDEPVPAGFNDSGSSFSVQGQIMRMALTPLLSDVGGRVDCDQYEYLSTAGDPKLGEGVTTHFDQTYWALEHSIFCLFLPGATGMGHRFAEAMMAGCIPVSIGPPFAPLPFLEDLRYSAAIVLINVTHLESWKLGYDTWVEAQPEGPIIRFDELWKSNDVSDPELGVRDAISVPTLESIPALLQGFSDEEVERRLRIVADISSRFAFDVEVTSQPNAVNILLAGICRRSGRQGWLVISDLQSNGISTSGHAQRSHNYAWRVGVVHEASSRRKARTVP